MKRERKINFKILKEKNLKLDFFLYFILYERKKYYLNQSLFLNYFL
jgi:hypothetical protein